MFPISGSLLFTAFTALLHVLDRFTTELTQFLADHTTTGQNVYLLISNLSHSTLPLRNDTLVGTTCLQMGSLNTLLNTYIKLIIMFFAPGTFNETLTQQHSNFVGGMSTHRALLSKHASDSTIVSTSSPGPCLLSSVNCLSLSSISPWRLVKIVGDVCEHTCARGAGTHGDVLERAHGNVFSSVKQVIFDISWAILNGRWRIISYSTMIRLPCNGPHMGWSRACQHQSNHLSSYTFKVWE